MIYEIIVYELWILDFTVVSIRRRIGKLYICEIVNPQCKGCRVGRGWETAQCPAKYAQHALQGIERESPIHCVLAETCGSVKVV